MVEDDFPLPLYAAVVAARGEGYPLEVVLEHEGISLDAWEDAEERWAMRLTESAEGDLSLFDAMDRELSVQRARFARPVEPLDDDLDQFMVFQRHLTIAERPVVMLAEHGLFLGDWVRLTERWAERFAADSELRARAAVALQSPEVPPLSEVRPGPRALPPPARTSNGLPAPGASGSEEEPAMEWGLAALRAGSLPPVLPGTPAESAPPSAPLSEVPPLSEDPDTITTAIRPPPLSLPLPASTAVGDVPWDIIETAMAPLVPVGRALPFEPPGAPPAQVLVWPGEALEADAALEPEELDPTVRTAPALLGPVKPALPFGPSMSPEATAAPALEAASAPALPFQKPDELPLQAYAALCAELAVFPDTAEATFARYGLGDPAKRAAVDAAWKERLRRDDAEYAVWRDLYRRYLSYWMHRGNPADG